MIHQVHPAIATPSWYQGLRQWALRLCLSILVCLCAPQGLVQAQTVYFHNDVAGSPIAATDEAGNLLWRESYRPYGERMLKPAAANSQWFHGKPTDPSTGVSDFGARNYDPVLGRFLSIDPVDFTEKNIHSFNRYNYGNNNPLKFKDPDGRESTGQWIDNNAMQAAAAGNSVSTYGWAFAGTAWTYLGAEGISQLWDKGFSAGGFATMSAGIELAAVLPFGKLAGVAAKETTALYRAVGPEEFKSLMNGEKFAFGPNGAIMKQFGLNLSETLKYANWDSQYAAIIRVDIPTSVLRKFSVTFGQIDASIFRSGVVTLEGQKALDALNKAVISIKQAL